MFSGNSADTIDWRFVSMVRVDVMSFFQLCSQPGNRCPLLPRNNLAPIWNAYLTLDRTQWLSPAEIEQHQLSQARLLLDHCIRQVPYYRNLFAENGLSVAS